MSLLLRTLVVGALIWACASIPIATQVDPPTGTNQVRTLRAELAKMLAGQTEPPVIVTFIEQWQQPFLTSSEDLLALRKLGASPAILNAYARRGAELRLRAARATGTDARPSVVFYPVARPSANLPMNQ